MTRRTKRRIGLFLSLVGLQLALLFGSLNALAVRQTSLAFTSTSATHWTAPAGITFVNLCGYGGGAGGGAGLVGTNNDAATSSTGGAGGGGRQTACLRVSVSPGITYACEAGVGGTGGVDAGAVATGGDASTVAIDGGAVIVVLPGAGPGSAGVSQSSGPACAGGPSGQQQWCSGGNVSNIGNGPGFGGSSCGLGQPGACTFCNARSCPGFAAVVCQAATCLGGAAGTNGTTNTNAGGSGGGGGGAGGGGSGAAAGNGGNGTASGAGVAGTNGSNAGANTGAGGGGGGAGGNGSSSSGAGGNGGNGGSGEIWIFYAS